MPPNISIRRRLLVYLSSGLLATWLLTAVAAITVSLVEINEANDTQMTQLARSLPSLLPKQPVDLQEIDDSRWLDSGFADKKHSGIAIWNQNGQLLLSDQKGRELPYRPLSGFTNTAPWWHSHAWRVFYWHDAESGRTVAVAQEWQERLETLSNSVGIQLLILMLALPGLAWLLTLAVRHSITPLEALAQELSQRDADSLEPVSEAVPQETQPMVSALNQLLERVGEAREREQRFTADAAHELRSPLAALKVQTEVLAFDEESEAQWQQLQQIRHSIERSENLINQLLTLARLDPKQSLQNCSVIDWQAVSDQVMQSVNLAARERQIRLVRKMPTDAASAVLPLEGDAVLLQLLLRNLLENAIRYSPCGSTVTLDLAADHICVCDQGKGIAPEHLARIRERFYRPPGQDEQGSGLGLSIVERIAELHGLKLELENRSEGGLCARLVSVKG